MKKTISIVLIFMITVILLGCNDKDQTKTWSESAISEIFAQCAVAMPDLPIKPELASKEQKNTVLCCVAKTIKKTSQDIFFNNPNTMKFKISDSLNECKNK